MASYVITAPNGKKYKVTGQGSKEEALAHLQQQLGAQQPDPQQPPQLQQEQALPWYTPITYAPGNALDIAKGLYNTVRHPVDTANNLDALLSGAARNSNDYLSSKGLAWKLPAPDQRQQQNADMAAAAGRQIKDNFSSPTKAWNTVATHPIDSLLMFAPVIGQAAKGAELAGLGRTASALKAAAKFTDPVNAIVKPVGKVTGKFATRASDNRILKSAPSQAEVAATKNAMYKGIADQNIQFPADTYGPFVSDVKKSFEKIGKEAAPVASSHRQSVIDLLKGEGGKTLTDPYTGAKTVVPDSRTVKYNDIEEIRRSASDSSADMKLSDTERKVAGELNKRIQELYGTVPGLNEKLEPAKELARREILAKQIAEMQRKSEWYTSGNESGIKNQINAFGKKKGKGLTPQEEAAMKTVSQKEGINSLMSTIGGRLGHLAIGGMGATMGSPLGLPGMVAGMALGGGASLGARAISEAATLRALERAKKTILLGKENQKLLGVTRKGVSPNVSAIRALLLQHTAQP